MPFPNFDPVWFSIGPVPVRWYALAYVAGILLGWWYATRLARTQSIWAPGRSPVTPTQLDDLVLWLTIGIIGGGRLGYALFYRPDLFGQLFTGESWGERLELFQLWTGGMSFHGGFLGVAVAIILYARAHKVNLLSLGDLIAPVAPIGLFFGRIANFINGELWGRETDAPWGMVFCNDHIREAYRGQCPPELLVPRHPSQLYEAALEGILLFVGLFVAVWFVRLLKKPGYVTGLFLVGYGLCRALMETVREPDAHMPEALRGMITMGMLLSIPMILVGVWLIWRAWSRPPVAASVE